MFFFSNFYVVVAVVDTFCLPLTQNYVAFEVVDVAVVAFGVAAARNDLPLPQILPQYLSSIATPFVRLKHRSEENWILVFLSSTFQFVAGLFFLIPTFFAMIIVLPLGFIVKVSVV